MRVRAAAMMMALGGLACAGGPFFQRAAVVSMQITDCAGPHRSLMAALSGTPDTHHEICAEYILVSPTTLFRVQASRSAPLLLPDEHINFRPGRGALIVRRDDQQDDFEVRVVCMQLRSSKQETCAALDAIPSVSARKAP